MADILHHFPINGSARNVFDAITTPQGLDSWWTNECEATPGAGAQYKLDFGSGYEWSATVSLWSPVSKFELKLTEADTDWLGTRVGFQLSETGGVTAVRFHHLDWAQAKEHYQTSCFCWAMYLRLLKRYVEFGEVVPYEHRLNV